MAGLEDALEKSTEAHGRLATSKCVIVSIGKAGLGVPFEAYNRGVHLRRRIAAKEHAGVMLLQRLADPVLAFRQEVREGPGFGSVERDKA